MPKHEIKTKGFSKTSWLPSALSLPMVQCANLWQQGRTAWQNPMNRPPSWPSHQAYSNPASSCFRRRRHLKLLPAGSKRHPLSRLTWQSWSIWSLARKMLCRSQKGNHFFSNLQRDRMIKIEMIASDTTTNKPTRCSTTCPPTQEKQQSFCTPNALWTWHPFLRHLLNIIHQSKCTLLHENASSIVFRLSSDGSMDGVVLTAKWAKGPIPSMATWWKYSPVLSQWQLINLFVVHHRDHVCTTKTLLLQTSAVRFQHDDLSKIIGCTTERGCMCLIVSENNQ